MCVQYDTSAARRGVEGYPNPNPSPLTRLTLDMHGRGTCSAVVHSGCSRKAGKTSERIFSKYRKGRVRNTGGEGHHSWYVCIYGIRKAPAERWCIEGARGMFE